VDKSSVSFLGYCTATVKVMVLDPDGTTIDGGTAKPGAPAVTAAENPPAPAGWERVTVHVVTSPGSIS